MIIHKSRCACQVRAPYSSDYISDVVTYLWGRNVLNHVIYEGEYPYQFVHGSMAYMEAILRLYPAAIIRRALPLRIPVSALRAHGVMTHNDDDATILCYIGAEENGDAR